MTHRAQSTFSNLTGDDFRGMLVAATASLELNAPIANSLNVFPVPDGDTGTNMYLTLKSAQPALDELKDATGDKVAQAVAYETLMGARGNSGVIMSQFFRGLAEGFKNRESFSGEDVARAFDQASQASYKAVGNPVEGTMLTVIRKAAEEAGQRTASGEDDPAQVLSCAYEAACQALLETPDLLLKLKEAGVVDAGGLGIVAIIDGMICYLNGEEPKILDIDVGQVAPSAAYLDATEQEEFGYCTQFLLSDFNIDVAEIRRYLEENARSTVVVGMEDVIKVHFHTEEPEAIVAHVRTLGSVSQLKMDDMDRQHRGFLEDHRRGQQEAVPLGVVVVASGSGIEQIFSDLGAVDIVRGGQTMNPSAKELSDSAALSAAAEVILLPNNSNIVPAARQAASLSEKPVHVLPTTSVPQGVSALLAFDPEASAESNLASMQDAMSALHSGELTKAVRSTTINGRSVSQGEVIALLDGQLVAASQDIEEALREMCRRAEPSPGNLITLYWGGDTEEGQAEQMAEKVRGWCPGVEIDLVYGGQPHYNYLVSIE